MGAAAGSDLDPDAADGRAETGHRRRVGRVVVAGLVGLAALYAVALLVAPAIPGGRVARGDWRLYRCEVLGGSIPPDFSGMVQIVPGVAVSAPVAVRHGDKVYVAETAVDADGHELGAAVWSAPWGFGGPVRPVQAANDLASRVARNPDGVAEAPSSGAVDAAASCATRRAAGIGTR